MALLRGGVQHDSGLTTVLRYRRSVLSHPVEKESRAGRPRTAHAGGRRPHRAHPRAGRRRAGPPAQPQYEREERFPREVFRMLGRRRAARPALRRGRRRRRAALRRLPAGRRGAGGALGQRRARRQRAHAVLQPDRRSSAPRRSAATCCPTWSAVSCSAPTRLSEAHAGSDPAAMRASADADATTAGWPAARRPGSPTAATRTSTRPSCAPPTTASAASPAST